MIGSVAARNVSRMKPEGPKCWPTGLRVPKWPNAGKGVWGGFADPLCPVRWSCAI